MSDLSAYVDFEVTLDKAASTPRIVIADKSSYPGGLDKTGVTAFMAVTQPDGITVAITTTPDITYVGGHFTTAIKELRLATDGNFQKGSYLFEYTVKSAGFEDTVVSRTVNIYYDGPVPSLYNDFDVFTPMLKVTDTTTYTIPGFTLQTDSRSWRAVLDGVAVVSSDNVATFDLIYNNSYFDTDYHITLASYPVYKKVGATWVVVMDKIVKQVAYGTTVPASLFALYSELTSFLASMKDGCGTDSQRLAYTLAFTEFQHLIMRLNYGSKFNLTGMVENIQRLLGNGADPSYSHTMAPIVPYAVAGFGGIAAAAVSDSPPLLPFEYIIGTGSGYTVSSDGTQLTPLNTVGAPLLINGTLTALFLESSPVPLMPRSVSVYATFDPATGIITLTNGTFTGTTFVSGLYRGVNGTAVVPTPITSSGASSRTYTFVLAYGGSIAPGVNVTNQLIIEKSGTISKALINAKTGPVGASLIVDIKLNGTSIWNTTPANRLKILSGATSGSQVIFDTTTVTAGGVLSIDVVQVGSTTPGSSVTIQFIINQ